MLDVLKQNIKQQLLEKNLSIAELERRAGIPHAIVNIMHGRSKNPTIRVAKAIAKELGCTVDELLYSPQPISANHHLPISSANPLPSSATPPSSTNNQAESLKLPLLKQAFLALQQHLVDNSININFDNFNYCLHEIYKYSLGTKEQAIDLRFVEWIAEKVK